MKLNRASKTSFNAQRGFTILEIIVVVVILGIIMAFAANQIFGKDDVIKVKLTKIAMKNLKAKISLFRVEYNQLPSSLSSLTACDQVTGPGCAPTATADDIKDAWGNDFQYTLKNGGRSFEIKSFGADGAAGGEEVNFDITDTGP
jgi:general secretion pathway protein G